MRTFLSKDWAPGIVLTASAVLALCIANSQLHGLYLQLLDLPLGFEALHLRKPILLWVNDALMAVFFFLVGLEIKREILAGELSSARRLALPLVAAVGGMALPAAIYVALNLGDPVALRGWAIPSATDIAFALGVLSLIGSRAPSSLKVFLTAVAIIDDLGAILIIAFFYADAVSLPMLGGAAACAAVLLLLNLAGVRAAAAFAAVGAVMWFCVLQSGVHPTLAGVATALAIPLRGGAPGAEPLLERLEHALKPWVNFLILPIFAFANAGLALSGIAAPAFTHSITLGIVLGLLLGKAFGIFTTCWGLARLGWAEFPAGAGHAQMFGVACLCGIGFTMSLFIGSLAFGDAGESANLVKLGVMSGSALSAGIGAAILLRARERDAMNLRIDALAAGAAALSCCAAGFAGAAAAPAQTTASFTPPAVMQTLTAQRLPVSAVSFLVLDPDTGHTVTGLNVTVPRSPASTVKVLTTYASLDMLGPAYTWRTRALLRGELDNGTLNGDLVLQGGGDPFMTLERWWGFARALRTKGLHAIHGNIIIDNSQFAIADIDPGAFDGRPHRNYNVLPDALMVNFQNIEFRLQANPTTRKVDVVVDPAPVNLIVDNRVRFSNGRCRGPSRRVDFGVDGQDTNRVSFTGLLSAECAPRSFNRVLMNPVDYAYGTFLAIWRELGGEFDGKLVHAPAPPDARAFHSYDSLSLAEIVRLTNKFSSNLMARHLLLTVGMEKFGAPGTPEKGAKAIEEWSTQRGLPLADVDIDNGSGLSRATKVSVTELASVLNSALHSRYAPEFLSSLPLAGMDGTLRSRLREAPAGAVRLKTGHLNAVSGIAGFVTSNSGKTYVVVSLVNHVRADFGAGEPVHAALVDWVLENL